jgi:hypothetical protein
MNLNIDLLKNSDFFKTGQCRFNYSTQEFMQSVGFCMYETTEQRYFRTGTRQIQNNYPRHRYITVLNLQHALKIEYYDEPNRKFLPEPWLSLIREQFQLVTTYLDQIQLINPTATLVDSYLLIAEPGYTIHMHRHHVPQTVTFCWTKQEQYLTSGPKSRFLMGFHNRRPIELPAHEWFYFQMRDDPPHEVQSNEWRFFWFNDFDAYTTIPDNIDILEWRHDLLLGGNLDSIDHVSTHKKPTLPISRSIGD